MYDHVLILAYGQPSSAAEIKPFLESQIKSKELSPDRLAERTEHHQRTAGANNYAKTVQAFSEKLEKSLAAFGHMLPVYTGMRHLNPSLKDGMEKIKKKRHSRGLVLILAPFKCELTYERYQEAVDAAKQAAGLNVQYEYLKVRHNHPLFIQALADKARNTMRTLTLEQREFVHVVFTAPSIPKVMGQLCDYEKEISSTCQSVIKDVSQPKWSLCYHSREPGKEAWIDPDFTYTLSQFNKDKERHVLFVPVGAIGESVETLYDLDVDYRKKADTAGYGFMRAPAVLDHPKVLLMALDLLLEKIKG